MDTSQSGTRRWSGKVGPYELRDELARGGIGVVYRAWDPGAEREVALKLLLAAGTKQIEEVRSKRVLREAETLARVRHPNVVTVHACGQHNGVPYLVLELVDGESLDRRLVREEKLSPGEAARIGARIASALANAHAQGVLHRDVKPGNILMRGSDHEPLLTDFGLALDLLGSTTRLSQAGAFLGTPQYWPPEQARGELKQLGAWSDVYALGATLYHLLTGRPPHEGATLHEMVAAAGRAKIPVRQLRPEVSPALASAVERCLEPDPTRRPEMAALARELEQLVRHPGGAGARSRARFPLIGGAIACALLLALVLITATSTSEPREKTEPGAMVSSAPAIAPPPEPLEAAYPAGWEVLRIDPAMIRDTAVHPGMEAFLPWAIRLDPVIRFRGSGDEKPELALPLDCDAGPFTLRLVCAVSCMDPGTVFNVCLEPPVDAGVQWPPVRMFLAGTDLDQDELHMFSATVGETPVLLRARTVPPLGRPALTLEVAYGGRASPKLRFRCAAPGRAAQEKSIDVTPLPSGTRRLRIGLNLHSTSDAAALRHVAIELHRIELATPRGGVRPALPASGWGRQQGRLGRRFLAGSMEEVARTGTELGVKATTDGEGSVFPAAAIMEALALVATGKTDEAITQLEAHHKAAALERDMLKNLSSWYERIAARALTKVGAAERRAFARASLQGVPSDLGADAMLALAREKVREGLATRDRAPVRAHLLLAEAAMLYIQLQLDQPQGAPLDLAQAWFELGDYAHARELYAAHGPLPLARIGVALCEYRLARWREAAEAFDSVTGIALSPQDQQLFQVMARNARDRIE